LLGQWVYEAMWSGVWGWFAVFGVGLVGLWG
jgi:hypothetical protein